MSNGPFDDVLASNARFAATFGSGGLDAPAARGLAVLTCMDARLDPLRMLGLGIGDAKVLRNPGARVTGAIVRALVLARYLLGCERCMVVAHTRCAMASGDDARLHAAIEAAGGPDTRTLTFGSTADQESALRADVQRLRSSPYLPDLTVGGFVYDVDSGKVREVC